MDETCQIYVFEGADPEVNMEDLDREVEERCEAIQVMLSNNREKRSKLI
jgi:hypothetical protein